MQLYTQTYQESLKLLDFKASEKDFVNRNAKIDYIPTNNVTIKFSNKLIFVARVLLYWGSDNEKIALD